MYQVNLFTYDPAVAYQLLQDPRADTATLYHNSCPQLPGAMLPVADHTASGALHFVGFSDDRYWAAVKVWGKPDFFHRVWDHRAVGDIVDGDTVVFASKVVNDRGVAYVKYDPDHDPSVFSWDDSARF
jgi:hypothetical protein